MPRQYARFAGIVHGEKTRTFFAKLVRLGYASAHECRHNRARIYHLNQRALYAVIGKADSRIRKPVVLHQAMQRLLMVLDAIVEDPDLVWLATPHEKATHLTTLTRMDLTGLPHVTVGEGDTREIRYFPDRLPIAIHSAGRGVLVYVVTDAWLDEFRVFLERHAALLRDAGRLEHARSAEPCQPQDGDRGAERPASRRFPRQDFLGARVRSDRRSWRRTAD